MGGGGGADMSPNQMQLHKALASAAILDLHLVVYCISSSSFQLNREIFVQFIIIKMQHTVSLLVATHPQKLIRTDSA